MGEFFFSPNKRKGQIVKVFLCFPTFLCYIFKKMYKKQFLSIILSFFFTTFQLRLRSRTARELFGSLSF